MDFTVKGAPTFVHFFKILIIFQFLQQPATQLSETFFHADSYLKLFGIPYDKSGKVILSLGE